MTEDLKPVAPPRFDLERLAALPRPLVLAAIPALASLVLFATLPVYPHFLQLVQKLGHPGVFGLIAILTLALQLRPGTRGRPAREYLLAFANCVLLGAATEIGQIFTHRDPALADVGLDALGALSALGFTTAFDARVWGSTRHPIRIRSLGIAVGIGLSGALLVPISYSALAYLNRYRNFPVLFAPSSRFDLYFLESGRQALETVPGPNPGESYRALRVPLTLQPYDGVTIFEPYPAWRGYNSLTVAVANPGLVPLELTIRVDDRQHNGRYQDRYDEVFRIEAGAQRLIEIPLEAIEGAPRGRRLDLGHIGRMVIFRAGSGGPRSFLLERVALR